MFRNLCATCSMQAAENTSCPFNGETVAAGQACSSPCVGTLATENLAQINFPIQSYTEGFCPCEALSHGTLFPELIG